MKYIDIHTHTESTSPGVLSVFNVFPDKIPEIKENQLYSVGIHPWYVNPGNLDKELNIIEELASKSNFIAIGEIGLDKLKPNFELQKEVFLKQINLAEKLNKPIVMHCVRAYNELLQILKQEKLTVSVIIHRFSGNKETAEQLLKYNVYLSFGEVLLNPDSKTSKIFKEIPESNFFLETDDSDISISEIYKAASFLKETVSVKKTVFNNFVELFSIYLNP